MNRICRAKRIQDGLFIFGILEGSVDAINPFKRTYFINGFAIDYKTIQYSTGRFDANGDEIFIGDSVLYDECIYEIGKDEDENPILLMGIGVSLDFCDTGKMEIISKSAE